jgi:hypothetical protein
VDNLTFLQAVFGAEWERAHLACFSGDPTSADLDRRVWAGGAAKEKAAWAIPTRNNYFTVSLFDRDVEGIARRRKALFRSMHIVVVDDVDGKKVRPETALRLLGAPSYRLETSPGNEQWGYLFDEPLQDRFAGELLVDAMVKEGLTITGNDPGMKGVTRYVRLPVGRNGKAIYGASGFATILREWAPERRYSPATLAAPFGIPDLADAASVARRRAEMEREGLDGRGEDALLHALDILGLVKFTRHRGDVVDITCPFVGMHTMRADNGTAYMKDGGGIACHHGHCQGKTRGEYVKKICEELSALGTPEAESAIYNLTSLANLRRSLRVAAIGLMSRGADDVAGRVMQIARADIDDEDVAHAEVNAAMRWARETKAMEAARPTEFPKSGRDVVAAVKGTITFKWERM